MITTGLGPVEAPAFSSPTVFAVPPEDRCFSGRMEPGHTRYGCPRSCSSSQTSGFLSASAIASMPSRTRPDNPIPTPRRSCLSGVTPPFFYSQPIRYRRVDVGGFREPDLAVIHALARLCAREAPNTRYRGRGSAGGGDWDLRRPPLASLLTCARNRSQRGANGYSSGFRSSAPR